MNMVEKIICEITALKSKMYSMRDVKKNGKSILKGHNSYISNNEYNDTLFNKKTP